MTDETTAMSLELANIAIAKLKAEREALKAELSKPKVTTDTRHRPDGYNYTGWRVHFYLAAGAKGPT